MVEESDLIVVTLPRLLVVPCVRPVAGGRLTRSGDHGCDEDERLVAAADGAVGMAQRSGGVVDAGQERLRVVVDLKLRINAQSADLAGVRNMPAKRVAASRAASISRRAAGAQKPAHRGRSDH
jgi:hypothetical protein